MKISQIDEGVLDTLLKRGEAGADKAAAEKGAAATSKADALSGYKAPGTKVNNVAPIDYKNQGPKAPPGAATKDVKVSQTAKPAEKELTTKGEKVPAQIQARMDAEKAAAEKAAAKAADAKPGMSTKNKAKIANIKVLGDNSSNKLKFCFEIDSLQQFLSTFITTF